MSGMSRTEAVEWKTTVLGVKAYFCDSVVLKKLLELHLHLGYLKVEKIQTPYFLYKKPSPVCSPVIPQPWLLRACLCNMRDNLRQSPYSH